MKNAALGKYILPRAINWLEYDNRVNSVVPVQCFAQLQRTSDYYCLVSEISGERFGWSYGKSSYLCVYLLQMKEKLGVRTRFIWFLFDFDVLSLTVIFSIESNPYFIDGSLSKRSHAYLNYESHK